MSEDHDHSSLLSVGAFKGVSIAATFAIAAVGGFVPFLVGRRGGTQSKGGWSAARVLPVCNAASAGVFLAAALMHLLADALGNEELSELSEEFWGDGHDHGGEGNETGKSPKCGRHPLRS